MVEVYIIGAAVAALAAVAARSAIQVIWRRVFRPKVKGRKGESTVSKTLRRFTRKGTHARNDILLNTSRGTSQLDHLLITKQGLVVIETKNYSGVVYGDAEAKLWTQSFPGSYSEPRQFYNPIQQNKGHISALRGILKDHKNIPIHSLVVFPDSCSFPHHPGVVSFSALPGAIKLIMADKPALSDEQVKDIAGIIDKSTNLDRSARAAHNYKAGINASVSPQEMKEFIRQSQENAVNISLAPAAPAAIPGQEQRRFLTDTGAKLTIHKQSNTIEGFFESAKRRNDGERIMPGGNFDFFICPFTNDKFPASEALSFYQGLWITYLNNKPELVDYMKATGPENLGNSYRCKKVLAQYTNDKDAFISQVKASAWYQNMAGKYQPKEPIDKKIQTASAQQRCVSGQTKRDYIQKVR